jgi:hypothetical protein
MEMFESPLAMAVRGSAQAGQVFAPEASGAPRAEQWMWMVSLTFSTAKLFCTTSSYINPNTLRSLS